MYEKVHQTKTLAIVHRVKSDAIRWDIVMYINPITNILLLPLLHVKRKWARSSYSTQRATNTIKAGLLQNSESGGIIALHRFNFIV
jgi:hypothetical protein